MISFPGLAMAFLRALPVHALSRLAGRGVSLPLPSALRAPACRAFAGIFGANLDEVERPLAEYASIQDFFVRRLAAGARPVDPAPDAWVAPCDGAWGESGTIERGQLLQVKGRPYALSDLLGDAEAARAFEGGAFATLYLAPRDYHRFHTPCAAHVLRAVHLPGSLWPVNRIGLEGVDGLFAENERIVAFFAREGAEAEFAIAAVGATMVGKVHVTFDDLTTNLGSGPPRWRHYDEAPAFEKGEEWGRFEFGSTLVIAARPGALVLDAQPVGAPLRLGARIGTLG
ncbi:MAG: archaetidylserine decarboxylase [Myxococcota bacterium]